MYFPNEDGLLPHVDVEENKFDEIWEKLGAEFKSKSLTMLPVTPYYIVFVSCLDDMKLDEIQKQLELQIHGYVAAKSKSRDSWRGCRQREDLLWTKVTGGFRCCL